MPLKMKFSANFTFILVQQFKTICHEAIKNDYLISTTSKSVYCIKLTSCEQCANVTKV